MSVSLHQTGCQVIQLTRVCYSVEKANNVQSTFFSNYTLFSYCKVCVL